MNVMDWKSSKHQKSYSSHPIPPLFTQNIPPSHSKLTSIIILINVLRVGHWRRKFEELTFASEKEKTAKHLCKGNSWCSYLPNSSSSKVWSSCPFIITCLHSRCIKICDFMFLCSFNSCLSFFFMEIFKCLLFMLNVVWMTMLRRISSQVCLARCLDALFVFVDF